MYSSKEAVRARDRRTVRVPVLPAAVHPAVHHPGQRVVQCASSSRGKVGSNFAGHGGDRAARGALGTIGGCVSSGSTSGVTTAPNRARTPDRWQRTPARKEKTPDELAEARVRQYKLQELAGDILPEERGLNACMRCRVAVADRVQMVIAEVGPSGEGNADYTHLQTCGSIWLCAPCAARESERRRKIMTRMNKKFIEGDSSEAGGSIWMTTYTISHHDYDALDQLLEHFLAARKQMREGRRGMALRHNFDVVGTISVLEVTWSPDNGWHPHVHELVYCRTRNFDADGYEALARPAWKHAAAGEGLSMNEHGFELRRTYGAVQDYVTKFGHQPASEKVWGTESEMVKGHLKRGRMGKSYTPFAMLDEMVEVLEAIKVVRRELAAEETVDRVRLQQELRELRGWLATLGNKYREYAKAFKGKKQLNPSKGVQPLWKQAEAEVEEEEKTGEAPERHVLVSFYDDQWNEVVRRRRRGELLEKGRTGRPGRVLTYLADLGARVFPEQYTRFERWRVVVPGGLAVVTSVQHCPVLQRWRVTTLLDEPGPDGRRWQAYDFDEIILGLGSEPPGEEGSS